MRTPVRRRRALSRQLRNGNAYGARLRESAASAAALRVLLTGNAADGLWDSGEALFRNGAAAVVAPTVASRIDLPDLPDHFLRPAQQVLAEDEEIASHRDVACVFGWMVVASDRLRGAGDDLLHGLAP